MLVAVEIDSNAAETYRCNLGRHYGVKVLQEDIRTISVERVLKEAGIYKGELTLLVGGPPCQGFSTANCYRSLDDPRSKLMNEFVRMVRGIMPRVFEVENVPGLFSYKDFFILLMETLEKCGYVVRCLMMDAVSYGIPQYRKRIFIQGMRKDLKMLPIFPKPEFFDPEQLRGENKFFTRAEIAIRCFAENGFPKEEIKDLYWNEKLHIQMNRKKAGETVDIAVGASIAEGIKRIFKQPVKSSERGS